MGPLPLPLCQCGINKWLVGQIKILTADTMKTSSQFILLEIQIWCAEKSMLEGEGEEVWLRKFVLKLWRTLEYQEGNA